MPPRVPAGTRRHSLGRDTRNLQPSPARRLALELLLSLRDAEAPGFDVRLDDARRSNAMNGQDIALAREIAFGVSRQRRWLEEVLSKHLHKPLPTQAYQVRDALLMGIFQALYLDRIPAHTVVDDTVKLVASVRTEAGYRALANAIMRKVVATPREDLLPPADTSWPVRYSVPDWLSSEAGQVYKGNDLVAFFAACNEQAPLCLRATALADDLNDDELEQTLKSEIANYLHVTVEIVKNPLLPRTFAVRGRGLTPDHLPSFRSGKFTVEDEGAQIVSYLAGAREGMSVLDLCASPGGKTANLADLAKRKLARLVASDVSENKLARLRETLQRLHLMDQVETKLAEDVLKDEPAESFDLVLVDAPCSALGTMRRHPEVRWKRSVRDLRAVGRQQLELLTQAAKLVKPGGVLVYSVCTFTKTETDSTLTKFLELQKDAFEPADAPEGLPFDAQRFSAGPGRWRTSPQRDGCDAFFVARLRKNP